MYIYIYIYTYVYTYMYICTYNVRNLFGWLRLGWLKIP